jgi:hypothetical protein
MPLRIRPLCRIAVLLALVFATSLFARGQYWDFLGDTQVDGRQNHGQIQINRRDCTFRTIQLRVSGQAIFSDRLVVHFDNGHSQELIVSERISPEGPNYIVELPGEGHALESVELWYYKEHWARSPRVSMYGVRAPRPAK